MAAVAPMKEQMQEEDQLVLPIDIGDGQIPLPIGFSEMDDLRRRAYFRGEPDVDLETPEKQLLLRLGVDVPMKEWIAPHLPAFFMNLQNCQSPLQMQLSSKCSLNQLVLWNILFADTAATRSRLKADGDLSAMTSGVDLAKTARALKALKQPPWPRPMPNTGEEETEEDYARLFTLIPIAPVAAAAAAGAAGAAAGATAPVPELEEVAMISKLFTLTTK